MDMLSNFSSKPKKKKNHEQSSAVVSSFNPKLVQEPQESNVFENLEFCVLPGRYEALGEVDAPAWEAQRIIRIHGGKCVANMSDSTDYIIGDNGNHLV